LQILGEGAGCDLINILENFFDIIQQLKLDFSSLHLYDSLCATEAASIRSSFRRGFSLGGMWQRAE
jgi:hypothetical protein